MEGARVYGVVLPLVTDSTGAKFGKSEGQAVWLDGAMTSPFRFYQYWISLNDADVVRYLRYYTLLSDEDIAELAHAVAAEPHKRAAQTALAEDVTRRLHGEDGLTRARRATGALFGGNVEGIGADEIADIFSDVPSSEVSKEDLAGDGKPLVDLLAASGLASSKGDARRAIEGGGAYVNNVRAADVARSITIADTIDGRFALLRRGKKNYHLVAVRD
jgi:tyrosyl-tRNA synthetase